LEIEGKPGVQTWPSLESAAIVSDAELALTYEAELSA
jgi:hypothetical protein